jgi:hypothetical protein
VQDAEVSGDRPRPGLTDELRADLREWAAVAEAVRGSGDPHELDQLGRRGRQLAVRVAQAMGRPVDFVDPVSGRVESIRAGDGHPPLVRTAEPPGPTPWAAGLAVAAFFAVFVAVADVVLATAFADGFGLLWVPANVLVTAGTLPSLWLARKVPLWRWPALGAAAGLAAAWVVLLAGMLG